MNTGFRPGTSYSSWVRNVTTPVIVQKTIRPITDLFTADYMSDIKGDINYTRIKSWLEDRLDRYCYLFKDEYRCNNVLEFPVCLKSSGCRANMAGVADTLCGLYSGNIDQDFLPDDPYGVLVEEKSGDIVWDQGFDHGCFIGSMFEFYVCLNRNTCPANNAELVDTLCGMYRGDVDEDFLPHDYEGVLTNNATREVIWDKGFQHGCFSGNYNYCYYCYIDRLIIVSRSQFY